ncbi:hypothetical protein JXO59_12460, partial [candidate division KSB1 bacterium]|nr:hypothetical protein [candidate division KSB1 bacterium]
EGRDRHRAPGQTNLELKIYTGQGENKSGPLFGPYSAGTICRGCFPGRSRREGRFKTGGEMKLGSPWFFVFMPKTMIRVKCGAAENFGRISLSRLRHGFEEKIKLKIKGEYCYGSFGIFGVS